MSAEDVLRFSLEQFPGKVALACSFQKEETVLLDLLFGLEPKARVFAIDTHYLFPETSAYWREVEPRATALGGLGAWIPGVRRDQSPTRANAPKIVWDEQHELWKVNPLADWT